MSLKYAGYLSGGRSSGTSASTQRWGGDSLTKSCACAVDEEMNEPPRTQRTPRPPRKSRRNDAQRGKFGYIIRTLPLGCIFLLAFLGALGVLGVRSGIIIRDHHDGRHADEIHWQ